MHIVSTARRRFAWVAFMGSVAGLIACAICYALFNTWAIFFSVAGTFCIVALVHSYGDIRENRRIDSYNSAQLDALAEYHHEFQQFVGMTKVLPYALRTWPKDVYSARVDKESLLFVYRIRPLPLRKSYVCRLVQQVDVGVKNDTDITSTLLCEQVLILPAGSGSATYHVRHFTTPSSFDEFVRQCYLQSARYFRRLQQEDDDACDTYDDVPSIIARLQQFRDVVDRAIA